MDSDSDENWSRMFEFHDSEDFADNNTSSPVNYIHDNSVPLKYSSIGHNPTPELPKRGPSNHENKIDLNVDQLRPRRSLCQFKTPSNESIRIEETPKTREDPKELYLKTICGDVSPDFDPMRDYYERVAQVNTIHEYYKRPNLTMATRSSSKTDTKLADPNLSDSSTVIQHLTEFRNATNYIPPSNVSAYKVDGETMSEPAIITTSKTRLVVHDMSKPQVLSYAKKPSIEVLHKPGGSNKVRKVDVGTMMDICLAPSVLPLENQAKSNEPQPVHEEEKEQNRNSTEAPNGIESPRDRNANLHAILREKLRYQVYSQFDTTPKKPQNVFMVKSPDSHDQMLPPRSVEVASIPRANKLTDAINSEVEKALKNLTAFPTLQFHGSQRRDEIVKQSKDLLRQRIMNEVYSQFEKGPEQIERVPDTKPNFCTKIVEEAEKRESETEDFLKSEERIVFPSESFNTYLEDVEVIEQTEESVPQSDSQKRESRTVGMSTESYPKLNPDLTLIIPSKCSTQKSRSIYFSEDYPHDFNVSRFKVPAPDIHSEETDNTDADVVNEILEQFQKNVCIVTNQNELISEPRLDPGRPHLEKVLRIDALSPNIRYNETIMQQTTLHSPEAETSGPITRTFGGETYQRLETQPMDDSHMQIEQIGEIQTNVYYFQQPPHYNFPVTIPPPPMITTIGDDCTNVNMKTVARNLVDDYREEPKNANEVGLLDINKFIQFIKEKFPNITLKQLKEIILNLPSDDPDSEELFELGTRMPPPATFRSDFEKYSFRPELSEKPTIDTTMYSSSDYPTDFSVTTTVTAWRAHFSPPIDLYSEPIPQFKPISRFDTEISLVDHIPREVKAAAELNLPRSPITCPITACSKLIFVSEFSKHIKMDHVKIPVETLTPGKCRNIFLDPKSDEYGVNKCHILYLVTGKIRDLGSKEFKDYLPLLVMATKVSMLQLISPLYHTRSKEVLNSQQNYLMIWLTGLSPHDLPIYFSLTAWHRYSTIPKCHMVHSGRIYSIRNKHDDRSVYNSGNAMLLSQNQVRLLTNNGQDMIELQVIVH
ncbi:unnamed protein product [Hermetia illucens]|uniref:DUF4729 domain-containing protein n=2 Tax=Hermetia illucens TaxID=343691 RepID=A0A7R8YPK3_HERIL|nr:unnamed protein product [Hermetia illucens]